MILLTEDQSRLLAAEPEAVATDPLTGRRYVLRPLPAAADARDAGRRDDADWGNGPNDADLTNWARAGDRVVADLLGRDEDGSW